MTKELKQKAEEYADTKVKDRKGYNARWELVRNAYIAGATENGIQWHDLRKDPNDLPKDSGLFIIYWKLGVIDDYMVFKGTLNTPHKDMIAWCEIPQFKE